MVQSELWWEFRPGQRVMTRERVAGTVQEVQDGPAAGNETYLVTLDAGLGGGEYGAGELSALPGTATAAALAAVEHTALEDYPELGTILTDRPPPARSVPSSELMRGRIAKSAGHFVDTDRSARLEQMAASLLAEANAERWLPDHPEEQSPYAGQHQAGWLRDLVAPPSAEHSHDWCRFRRESHCWFPKTLHPELTAAASSPVWQPVDRGRCPRGSWALQERCPVGEPGPNVRGGYSDLTGRTAAVDPDSLVETDPDRDPDWDEPRYRVNCPQHGAHPEWTDDWGAAMADAGQHLKEHHAGG